MLEKLDRDDRAGQQLAMLDGFGNECEGIAGSSHKEFTMSNAIGPPSIEWLATRNAYFRMDDDTLRLYCYFAPAGFLPLNSYQVTAPDCHCGCIGGTSGQPPPRQQRAPAPQPQRPPGRMTMPDESINPRRRPTGDPHLPYVDDRPAWSRLSRAGPSGRRNGKPRPLLP